MTEVARKPSTRAKLGTGPVPYRNKVSGTGQNIFLQGISWYFFDVPLGILKAWKNFLKFNLKYFSVILLLKTLFSTWKRDRESYGRGFDFGKFFEIFFGNLISRILGFLIRSVLIIIGLLVEIIIIIIGLFIFFSWLIMPVILFAALIFGINLLLSNV